RFSSEWSSDVCSFDLERYIPIEVVITEDLLINRQLISRVFNPKLGEGFLTYENDIVKRNIMAIPEHVPSFEDIRPRKWQRVKIRSEERREGKEGTDRG